MWCTVVKSKRNGRTIARYDFSNLTEAEASARAIRAVRVRQNGEAVKVEVVHKDDAPEEGKSHN